MLDVKTESQLYDEDLDFLEAHYDELLEKYPEQWVAVVDKRVIGADPDLLTLLVRLRPMGLPINRIVTEKGNHRRRDLDTAGPVKSCIVGSIHGL